MTVKAHAVEHVELYRLLYLAKQPMTMKDIIQQFPQSGYSTTANRALRAHLEAQGAIDPKIDRAKAWEAWIKAVLRSAVLSGLVCGRTREGKRCRPGVLRTEQDLFWTANPAKPPRIAVPTVRSRLVKWTPEHDDAGKRQAAGMRFLQQSGALLDRGSPKLPDDVRAALEDARLAIRVADGPDQL